MKEVLPDCRPRETKGVVYRHQWAWIPIFCANCGREAGYVPQGSGHAFYLCDSPCAEKWGQLAGTMAVPDEMFWSKVTEEMGRPPDERDLSDPDSAVNRLALERPKGA